MLDTQPIRPSGLCIKPRRHFKSDLNPSQSYIQPMPDQNTLLLIYFVAFVVLAFVLRSLLVYWQTGINPLVLSRSQDAYGYVGMAFKVLMHA